MWARREKTIWVQGEDAAARYMKRNGCVVIARNLRLGMGEIDLLCREKKTGTIIVVEVKARLHAEDTRIQIDPTASITQAKKTKLRTLARAIKKQTEYRDSPIRIDVVSVIFTPKKRRPKQIKRYQSAVTET
ncbi:MAG: YraN family protein [Phycisphaerales bacterium]|nr:YraN family protein [Phycisphaerales bacterium]